MEEDEDEDDCDGDVNASKLYEMHKSVVIGIRRVIVQ